MKAYALWALGIAAALAGCVEPAATQYQYDQPLTSPGGEFSRLPPAVQNSVRAEAGAAEIRSISKETSGDSTVYVIHFEDALEYSPLYVASNGSVLSPDLRVVVPATEETIEASTGAGSYGIKLDDLPADVVTAIRTHAPTGEVNSVHRIVTGGRVFYEVTFTAPEQNPELLVSDDGRVVK